MDFGIAGKVALVVGGSKGIGLESARMLAAEGARVAIVARTQKHIDREVAAINNAGGEAVGVSADMTQQAEIERAVVETTNHFGAPQIVITQADFHVRGFFEEITQYEDYVDSYRAYTMSQVYMLHAVLPAMKAANWGRYVHIGSATAKEPAGNIHHAVANTSRPSTIGLLKTVSDEYARHGVTVNTVAPGWIETENALAYLEQHLGASSEQERRDFMLTEARVPAARMGQPGEIASLVTYLCSERAGYLTGSWIEVDGGLHRSAF
jgi:3-oxoacyl-[acyl-carrier protein] reductase